MIKHILRTQREDNGARLSGQGISNTVTMRLKGIKDILKMNIKSGKLHGEIESLRKEPRGNSRFEDVGELAVRGTKSLRAESEKVGEREMNAA